MQEVFSTFARVESPTLEMVLFTFLLAFLCSVSIALCYYFTTPKTFKTANYIQALILSSVIATMILQSIGDNVASGLGILGALTIINFRTSFKDPRDIIFMFAALGIGIACGSYDFTIAVVGTICFCLLALTLKYSNFSLGNHIVWSLRLRIRDIISVQSCELVLQKYCKSYILEGYRTVSSIESPGQDRDYQLIFKSDDKQDEMIAEFRKLGAEVRRLNNPNSDNTEV